MTEMIPTWIDGDLVAVEKLEAHRRGLRHMAVSVFVLCGDAVLIQRRALGKYHTPGLWANTCCTHPRWGEAPLACAHRRLDEELGLRGLPLTPRGQVEYRADVGGGLIEHELVDVFLARVARRVEPVPNPEEVMAVDWITRAALATRIRNAPADFTPWLRIYLEEHAAQIFAGAEKLPGFPA
ncbi:MAG TPA: isopentenyl-diphosphate delta-isomerase [Roseovarius sp.]|nr:isopentenyl-diphosphate delta-isomerase [Roseovarius sp.]